MQKGKHTLCLVIVWGLLSFIFYTAVARSWNSVFKPVGCGRVCQRAHWSTAVQNKTKLWLSPGHHLQNYLIHFALLFSSESAWTLIALFAWVFISKIDISSLFPEPQFTLIYTHFDLSVGLAAFTSFFFFFFPGLDKWKAVFFLPWPSSSGYFFPAIHPVSGS